MASMRSPGAAAEIQSVPGPFAVEGDVDDHRRARRRRGSGWCSGGSPPCRRPAAPAASGPDPARTAAPRCRGPSAPPGGRTGSARPPRPPRGARGRRRPAVRPGRPTMSSKRSVAIGGRSTRNSWRPGPSARRRVSHDHPHARQVLEAGERAGRRSRPAGPRHAPRGRRSRPRRRNGAARTTTFGAAATGSASEKRPDPSKSQATSVITPVPSGTSATARKVSSSPVVRVSTPVAVHREGRPPAECPVDVPRRPAPRPARRPPRSSCSAGGATPSSTQRLRSRRA